MCKILAVADMSKVKDIKKLVNVAAKHIMETDDDGFGWAALGEQGVFGERTSNNFHYYRFESRREKVKLPIIKETYNKFGVKSTLVGGGMFHGRTSTNSRALINVHPLIKNDWTLIHNGVVNNQGPKYEMETSNDTEHLIHYMSTIGINAVEEHLTGYYAFAAIDPHGQLHIVRDSTASLHVAYVSTIESYVFGTTIDLIESVCKEMKWKCGQVDMLLENQHLIFQQNDMIHQETIKPRGYSRSESQYAGRSLGFNLQDYSGYATYESEYSKVWERNGDTVSKRASLERDDSGGTAVGRLVSVGNVSDEASTEVEDEAYIDWYIRELDLIDDTYEIYDSAGMDVQFDDFRKLDLQTKMLMNVIRPDGTVLSPPDYAEETNYAG